MMAEVDRVLSRIRAEIERSVTVHCDWSDYSLDQMVDAIQSEIDEFYEAYACRDVDGSHGMLAEGVQSAGCFVKLLVQLSTRGVSAVEDRSC